MYLEILLAIAFGIIAGIITGLIPGIHVNLVAIVTLSAAPFLLQFTQLPVLAVFIISLAITHTFLDSIPSIYLGAPDEAQALSVLPGHRLLLQGKGHNAILCTVIGSLGSLAFGIMLFPFFVKAMVFIYPFVKQYIGYILIFIMTYMILKEKGKRNKSFLAFLLAGILGLLVFNIPKLEQPLFPLLSGLFGCSILLTSLLQKSVIPPQDLNQPLSIDNKRTAKAVSAASGVGFIAAFLPGFGSSQAAIVATNIVGEIGDEGFLVLVGGINTANMLISIATAYTLEKARNGAIVVVTKLLGSIGLEEVLLFLGAALVVGGCASLLAISLSTKFARHITKINYTALITGIIGFILLLTIYFDGLLGLIILLTATAIGLLATSWNVGKNHLMGCLILPVILFFVL